MFEPCPCGVGPSYLACCARLHSGQLIAESPEQLMRARYSAYAKGHTAFLVESWSLETRPSDVTGASDREWLGLTIEAAPPAQGEAGTVRFAARWRQGGRSGVLRETSRFRREGGVWRYVDGRILSA